MPKHETYSIEIAGVKRELRLFEIKPGLKIAILNILGDTELVQASARELAQKIKDVDYDIIVTAEAKVHPVGVCAFSGNEKALHCFPQAIQAIHGRCSSGGNPFHYYGPAAGFDS